MSLKKFAYKLTHWETWHYLAKYIPLFPAWFYYCIRARSLWFFTASNPTITFGGMEGETKREMYDQLPPGSFPRSIYIKAGIDISKALEEIEKDYRYPFVVKPDVGMMGFMFRKVENEQQFRKYHEAMPFDYIIQEFICYPLEVSVFYYRLPNEEFGTITGFLKKEFLQVTGDGHSTLWELITKYQRVAFRLEEMRSKHESRLGRVLPKGEIFCLSPALNLSRGGKLVSLDDQKDRSLLKVFDNLSHYTKYFYYGRYDIRCNSVEDLKQGRNFSILEFNGCGAEPHHIYGNGNDLLQAYRIVLQHWRMLYKISAYNNRNGTVYWDLRSGIRYLWAAKKHFKLLKQIDAQFEI